MKIQNSKLFKLLPLIFYLLLTILFTWPIITKFSTHLYSIYGDSIGVLWYIWWPKLALQKGISIFWSSYSAAPFTDYVRFLSINFFLALPFSLPFGEVVAYNLFIFLSFVLGGWGMYLLVRHLTKNNLASFFAGFVFTFSPYHFVRATGHWDLAQIQWLPFFLLFLIKFFENRKLWSLFGAIIFFLLAGLSSPYYGMFLPLLTLLLALFFWGRGGFRLNSKIIIGLIIAFVLLLTTYYLLRPILYALPRDISELRIWSLDLKNYLLPSAENSIFGRFTKDLILKDLGGSNITEKTAYLGIIPLLLSLLGLIKNYKNKYIWFFVLSALLALWATLGPNGPAYLMYKIAPFVRSINRFSIFVTLSVAVLAGFGLNFILQNLKSKVIIFFLFAFLLIGSALELYVSQPKHIIAATKQTEVSQWLANLPENEIVVWLPMSNRLNNQSPEIHYFQRLHQKKLFNNLFYNRQKNTIPQKYQPLYEEFNQHPEIAVLNPQNLEILKKELGIKYIVVFTNLPPEEANRPVPDLSQNPTVQLVKKFETKGEVFGNLRDFWQDAEVYEIK